VILTIMRRVPQIQAFASIVRVTLFPALQTHGTRLAISPVPPIALLGEPFSLHRRIRTLNAGRQSDWRGVVLAFLIVCIYAVLRYLI